MIPDQFGECTGSRYVKVHGEEIGTKQAVPFTAPLSPLSEWGGHASLASAFSLALA
jgi:hypothetical protein